MREKWIDRGADIIQLYKIILSSIYIYLCIKILKKKIQIILNF